MDAASSCNTLLFIKIRTEFLRNLILNFIDFYRFMPTVVNFFQEIRERCIYFINKCENLLLCIVYYLDIKLLDTFANYCNCNFIEMIFLRFCHLLYIAYIF